MPKLPFLDTEEGKAAWKIREEQKEILIQKLRGWDALDITDPLTSHHVVEASKHSVDDFEKRAFLDKNVQLKFLKPPYPINSDSPDSSELSAKNLAEKFLLKNGGSLIEQSRTRNIVRKMVGGKGMDKRSSSLSSITEEDHEEFEEEGKHNGEESEQAPPPGESSVCVINGKIWYLVSENKGPSTGSKSKKKNFKKKEKKNRKTMAKEEETEDELMDRLIQENRKAAGLDQEPVPYKRVPMTPERRKEIMDFISIVPENPEEKERRLKLKELAGPEFQRVLAERIKKLEAAPIADIISKLSFGQLVLQSVEKSVAFFIKDIESVMKHGMHSENIENLFFDMFKEHVVIPDPNESPKIIRKRCKFVRNFLFKYKKRYVTEEDKYMKLRSFLYLNLLSQLLDGVKVHIPTLEVLVKLDGTPEFERKEDAILKTVLAQYFYQLDGIKIKI
ncbi:unnamed protein product [Caenorhabditis nigoni]